jgi:hypothetical protein
MAILYRHVEGVQGKVSFIPENGPREDPGENRVNFFLSLLNFVLIIFHGL